MIITNQTPLPKVAAILPTEAARLLDAEPAWITKEYVLTIIRMCLSHWHADGVTLDPIAFEKVINAQVAATLGMARVMTQQLDELDRIKMLLRSIHKISDLNVGGGS